MFVKALLPKSKTLTDDVLVRPFSVQMLLPARNRFDKLDKVSRLSILVSWLSARLRVITGRLSSPSMSEMQLLDRLRSRSMLRQLRPSILLIELNDKLRVWMKGWELSSRIEFIRLPE